MMRDYLNILGSILVALLTLTVVVAVISCLYTLISGSGDVADAIFMPFLIAAIGFAIFGISGSVSWLVFFRALGGDTINPMRRHAIAASLSVVSSITLSGVLFFRGSLAELGDLAIFFVPVVIVAVFGLFWCRLLFYKRSAGHFRI